MYSQLDGRYHAFLLTGLTRPKSLAIDPVEGFANSFIFDFWMSGIVVVGLVYTCAKELEEHSLKHIMR